MAILSDDYIHIKCLHISECETHRRTSLYQTVWTKRNLVLSVGSPNDLTVKCS